MHFDARIKSVMQARWISRVASHRVAWVNNFVTICRMREEKKSQLWMQIMDEKIYSATRTRGV